MPTSTKCTVLVAGAGLGGLAAAGSLMQRGFTVRLFEQAPQLGEVGAGIQQSANSVRVLYDLGLRDALERVGVKPKAYEFRRFDSAELLASIPFANAHAADGASYYHLHRADLHKMLADRVMQMDPHSITLNAKVVGFTESAHDVTLTLADGSTATGDVLIGADGIKSAVRAQIHGAIPATYTGFVAWRLTVPRQKLPADVMDLIGTVWCGPKNHCVVYWLRSGTVLNFVGCPRRAEWEDESWTERRPWEELKDAYAGWHPNIQTILDAADRNECFRWALNARPPIREWSTGRVTLLGDAAHPTLPFLAQGACMAIEDGAIVARALEGGGSVADALQVYQRARVDRCARVVTESREMGGLYHIDDADAMKRAFIERNPAKERAEWLFNYDPLTVPLPVTGHAELGS